MTGSQGEQFKFQYDIGMTLVYDNTGSTNLIVSSEWAPFSAARTCSRVMILSPSKHAVTQHLNLGSAKHRTKKPWFSKPSDQLHNNVSSFSSEHSPKNISFV